MRLPRVRITVRTMMVVVAAVAVLIYRYPEPVAAMRAATVAPTLSRQGWYLDPGTGRLRFSRYEPTSARRASPGRWYVNFERVSGEGPPRLGTTVRQGDVDAARIWWRPVSLKWPRVSMRVMILGVAAATIVLGALALDRRRRRFKTQAAPTPPELPPVGGKPEL